MLKINKDFKPVEEENSTKFKEYLDIDYDMFWNSWFNDDDVYDMEV